MSENEIEQGAEPDAEPEQAVEEAAAKRPSLGRRIVREVLALGAVVLVALSARATFADHYHVPSGSMLPTVEVGDRILVNKAAYGLRLPFTKRWVVEFAGPSPGDVVVLFSPLDGEVLLKRIVAVPGDLVAVRGGKLWRNGAAVPLDEEDGELFERLGESWHAVSFASGGGPALEAQEIPADRYLLMGDNRGDSLDGRVFGLVGRDAIVGRTVAIFARSGHPTWKGL